MGGFGSGGTWHPASAPSSCSLLSLAWHGTLGMPWWWGGCSRGNGYAPGPLQVRPALGQPLSLPGQRGPGIEPPPSQRNGKRFVFPNGIFHAPPSAEPHLLASLSLLLSTPPTAFSQTFPAISSLLRFFFLPSVPSGSCTPSTDTIHLFRRLPVPIK